jgi:hypothetical protein
MADVRNQLAGFRESLQYELGRKRGATQSDEIDVLARLGELRDAGVLTAEEFAAKKSQVLDGRDEAGT